MSIQDDIDGLLPDNTSGAISPEDLRDSFSLVTTQAKSAIAKAAETLTGFDREDMDVGGELNGILEYCHSAADGEVHRIGADESGTYTLVSTTTFSDGSPLTDKTLCQYHTPTETKFSYWYKGELKEETVAKKIVLPAGFKGYIYYDETGELTQGETDVRELIIRTTLVSYIYINSLTDQLVWYADERHGIVMDGQTHLQQHQHPGAFFVAKGLEITGIADNQSTFSTIGAGACGDEDVVSRYSEITQMSKLFRGTNGDWSIDEIPDNELGIFRSGDCSYNRDNGDGSWDLVGIGSDYVIMMPLASNNKLYPVIMLVGQKLHLNRGAARDNMPAEYFRINSEGLPSNEMHPLGSMIIHRESDGQIETGADGEIYTDCRAGFPVGVFT